MTRKDRPQTSGFPSTHWSLIFSARVEDSQTRREALDELMRLYLPPLRAHLLYRLRIEPNRVDDLLQDFVARQILERELLAKAEAARGRFRSFLLKSLQNYVFAELRDDVRKEAALRLEPPDRATCDVFEVEWARQLLQESLRRMKLECAREGVSTRWDFFVCRVVLPTLTGKPSPAYEALIERFGFRSAEHAANSLVTAKRQFERTVRAVVAEMEHLRDDAEIDSEIADLCRTLQNAGSLGVDWDRVLIAGQRDSGPCQESVSAVEESNPSELARLLGVRGASKSDWQPAELTSSFHRCFGMRVGEYLRIGTMSGRTMQFVAETSSEQDALSMPLEELFLTASPPLALLIAVKRHARRLANSDTSSLPAEIHRCVYFASIALAMIRLGERISKSSPDVLRAAFEQLADEGWIENWLRTLFSEGLRYLSRTTQA